ncbi:unnamed protein product [Phaeothamnion confervicola]
MYYLGDENLARQLVELGYRGSGDTLQREEFEARKRALRERSAQKGNGAKQLCHAGKDLSQSPFLQALASREELVRNGKLTTVIFLRTLNSRSQEVSAYIDYAHRLRTEDLEAYFEGKRKLMPRATDLSYYNWATQTSTSNSTPNFQVIADSEAGLLLKNKRDRKIIDVNPQANPGDNTSRTEIRSPEYLQICLFDHTTRRKS